MQAWIKNSVALLTITVASSAFAHTNTAFEAAQSIIEGWFTAMIDKKYDAAADFLAPEFVSIHTDGIVRNKKAEIELIKKLNLQAYKLSDFEFVQSGDVITVTYKDKGVEKIDNKTVGAKTTGRMAVLQKQGDKWLILAYANLDKI